MEIHSLSSACTSRRTARLCGHSCRARAWSRSSPATATPSAPWRSSTPMVSSPGLFGRAYRIVYGWRGRTAARQRSKTLTGFRAFSEIKTSTCLGRGTTSGLYEKLGRTRWSSKASLARASRSGPRTRGASPWSAASTSGTGGGMPCASIPGASGRSSSPVSEKGRRTSTRSSARTVNSCR